MALALKDQLARQAAGEVPLSFDPTGRDEPQLVSLPLRLIDRDPNQPRKDLGGLADLALSISEHGVLQPLIVEAIEGGRYRLLVGERRLAACLGLGLENAPCLVRTVAEQSRLTLQLIENLHRKDLHPVEEAHAFKHLMEEFNLDQRGLARRLGKSLASINETLRILSLGKELLDDVRTFEQVNKSVLLEIAKEADPERQQTLWEQAKSGQLTARGARTAIRGSPPASPRRATCTITVPEATVIVRFQSGEQTPDRVRGALEAALQLNAGQA